MDRIKLANMVEEKIKEFNNSLKLCDLENLIEETFKDNEKIKYEGIWIFQNDDVFDEDYDFDDLDKTAEYFIYNLDKYLNLYLEFSGDIEPSGIADVYISYTLDDDSRDKFIQILKDIRGKINAEDILATPSEVIDTLPLMHYGNIVENLKLENLKILK